MNNTINAKLKALRNVYPVDLIAEVRIIKARDKCTYKIGNIRKLDTDIEEGEDAPDHNQLKSKEEGLKLLRYIG